MCFNSTTVYSISKDRLQYKIVQIRIYACQLPVVFSYNFYNKCRSQIITLYYNVLHYTVYIIIYSKHNILCIILNHKVLVMSSRSFKYLQCESRSYISFNLSCHITLPQVFNFVNNMLKMSIHCTAAVVSVASDTKCESDCAQSPLFMTPDTIPTK